MFWYGMKSVKLKIKNLIEECSAYFTCGTTGWWGVNLGGIVPSVTLYTDEAEPYVRFVTPHTANRGVSWIGIAEEGTDSRMQIWEEITAGFAYKLSYKYKDSYADGGLSVRSGGNPNPWYTDVIVSSPDFVANTSWQDYSVEFIAPANYIYVLHDGVWDKALSVKEIVLNKVTAEHKLIIKHTSSTSVSGTVTTSSDLTSNYAGWKVLNNILTGDASFWASGSATFPQTWNYNFTIDAKVTKFRYHTTSYGSASLNTQPKSFTMEVSDNGTDWTVVGTYTDVTYIATATWSEEFTITTPTKAKHFRMNISNNYGNTNYVAIQELELTGIN